MEKDKETIILFDVDGTLTKSRIVDKFIFILYLMLIRKLNKKW